MFSYNILTILNDETNQDFIPELGQDNFPAFGLLPGSTNKARYDRVILEPALSPDFAIVTVVKPNPKQDGYLFSVVNEPESVVQLGVKVLLLDDYYFKIF